MRHSIHLASYCCWRMGLVALAVTLGLGAPSTTIAALAALAPQTELVPQIAVAVDNQPSETQQAISRLKQSQQRWIEVNLTTQRVIAWQGNQWIDAMIVSTGKQSTPTVTGVFNIYVKYPQARMQGADYDIPDVPHVMYFYRGYGFHGAYWHNRFGTPVSHGCINLAIDKAKWLFTFAAVGTPVVVHE